MVGKPAEAGWIRICPISYHQLKLVADVEPAKAG